MNIVSQKGGVVRLARSVGRICFVLAIGLIMNSPAGTAAQGGQDMPGALRFQRFFGWGAGDEEFIRKAAEIGVTDIITGQPTPQLLEMCARYNLNVYPCVTLSVGLWKKKYPVEPAPIQQMTPGQEKSFALIKDLKDEKFKKEIGYQWGGEPRDRAKSGIQYEDVLYSRLLCINHPRVIEALKESVDELLKIEGVRGIAFDFIGYQNYRDCHCETCAGLYREYCQKNNLAPSQKARDKFFLDRLVDFNNALVDHIHAVNPKALVVNHVYPVFLPEPLYGNRLKIDFCGQTVSWFFLWDLKKIEKYARITTGEQNKYWPGVVGVSFIGFGDADRYDKRSPERMEAELRVILASGSKHIMVCSLGSLLKNPDAAAVFKKFAPR